VNRQTRLVNLERSLTCEGFTSRQDADRLRAEVQWPGMEVSVIDKEDDTGIMFHKSMIANDRRLDPNDIQSHIFTHTHRGRKPIGVRSHAPT
jgi:hypothetical protein